MRQQTLQELLDRPYSIRVDALSEADGGGYIAYMPDLGPAFCSGVGESPSEALEHLAHTRNVVFADVVDHGDPTALPAPSPSAPIDQETKTFLLRLPTYLHSRLQAYAKASGQSGNAYVLAALVESTTVDRFSERLEAAIADFVEKAAGRLVPSLCEAISGFVPSPGVVDLGEYKPSRWDEWSEPRITRKAAQG